MEYRHQVQRDLEDASLAKAVAEFALRMRGMRESLALSGKLRTRYQKEYWFLDAASIYRQAVSTLADALTTIELGSRGFTGLRAYLADYVQSAAFTGLAADIGKVTSELAFRRGTLISARLGTGSKGTGYIVRRQPEQSWRDRIPGNE